MQRRKILLWSFLFLFVIAFVFYIFRYPLILQYQYSRLRTLKCKGDCLDRLWVHRVNSTERFSILRDKFKGFESDIIFDTAKSEFVVLHPPAAPGTDSLLLDTFFYKTYFQKNHYWLDTRFVDSSNMLQAWHALNRLARPYNISENCILEVYYPEVAQFLAGAGYKVSFNISERWLKNLPGNRALRDSLDKMLEKVPYVSQDAKYIATIKQLFPTKKILTWELSFNAKDRLQQLLDDPQIEAILVNIKSRYFR